ncbi:MAG: Rpn family recombination-promoting nuclease/putative transposase [Magnetococcales bacterium]|nr:Rpn family recombination-promoting nuclease/putative transposase [Magnetococcales bacterium]
MPGDDANSHPYIFLAERVQLTDYEEKVTTKTEDAHVQRRRLISFDWALKRLLRSKANFEVLEGLLSELLMTEVKIVEILESESNKENHLDKSNRVDMKVRNSQDELILIELQYEREYDYLQRLVYAISKTVTEHVAEGDAYSKVPKVISISILHFDLGDGQDYIYHGTTSFRGLHTNDELQLNQGQKGLFLRQSIAEIFPEFYLLRVKRFDEIARNSLDEWIYFLKTGEIREEFTARGLQKAKQVLDILQLPEEERRAYEFYQDERHYQASMVESTWVAGRLEGRQEGRQEEAASMLLKLIRRKFGQTPEWVTEKVKSANLELIETWSDNFVFANSVDEVFAS